MPFGHLQDLPKSLILNEGVLTQIVEIGAIDYTVHTGQ